MVLLGRMEDLLEKVGRYQRKLQILCEEARGWEANLPEVFLYDSGPEPSPGQQGCPRVATVGTGPRSGMTYRPPTSHGRVPQAARTRSQNKVGPSQEPCQEPSQARSQAPPRKEPEPGRRREVVEVPKEEDEDDDEEDERLRQEEDQRVEMRAKKRGAREEAEPSLPDSVPKRKKYVVRMEEGFDVERMVDKLLEGHNDLMNLKDILASAPKLSGELKGRLSRRLVPNVHLSTVLPREVEWTEAGTRMDWKCVACGPVDLVIKNQKCTWMVDTGAEMNIIREKEAVMMGMEIDRSDHGMQHGANCKAAFCGTASNVIIEIGKVRARTCFFVMPDVDYSILLGRSFLCRTETLIFNKHDRTMILLLCDPTCGNYEVITCRNMGPRSGRNRPNLGSFTFEESENELRRLWEVPEEEDRTEVLTLSLTDVNKAMEVVAAHDMADPEAIKALREQVLENPQGSQRRYKTVDKKCRSVSVLVTEDEEAYYERERGLIRRMREHALAGSCRINDENEGKLIIGEPDFLSPQERALMVGLMKKRHLAYAFNDDKRGRLDVDKIPMIRIHTVPHEPWNLRGARYPNPYEEKMVVDYLDGKMRTHDLQRSNVVTVQDAGGLPNADALSESCAGRPIISLIDLYSGYDQFPDYPPDRPVTAMHTPRGLIHMNVAPQGWTNAVAMVQRHMIRVMQTVSPHITQPYIDDLAVKGPKEKKENEVMPGVRRFVWKHVQVIDQVLSLLEPDVKKTDKIIEWSVPFRSITDVRSFLGTCGFWRSFVKDFATKTEHLRKLVRQDQEWVWGEDQEEAVGRMNGEFKERGLVLGAPNYKAMEERPFVIETDAGPTALGGVLIQADTEGKERLLRFESRTLNTTERNYSQFKKETLAERSAQRPGEPLHPRLEREVGAVVHLDLLFMPAGENGCNYIFDARDNLTGFVDGRAIRTKTGPVLANCIEEYYLRYPSIKEFVMDRGSEFTCNEVRTLLAGYGVVANYTTVVHPQANAPVERGHSTITDLLAKWTEGKHATLWYGRHATFPIESFMKTWRRQDLEVNLSFEELLNIRARQVEAAEERLRKAAGQVERSRMEDEMRWDQMARVRKESLAVGDVVLLYDFSLEKQWSRKLDKRWMDPYRILRCGEFGVYQIEELDGTGWQDWVSGTRLKKFVTLRASPLGRDGLPIRLEEGNVEEFIPAYEQYMHDQGTRQEEWMQTLPLWTRSAERPLARQIRDRARDWEDCQAQLRQAFRRLEPERPETRVERRQRSKRPRDPEARGATTTRGGRKALAQREEPVGPAQAAEPVQVAGPAQVAELPATHALEQVEFRRITGSDLRDPSPTLPEEGEAVPLRMPLDSLEAHLDASQWRTSQLGAGQSGPAWYEPAEDETEAEPRGSKEPRAEGVITVGDDTPPPIPIPKQARPYWPKGIPEPDSEEMSVPPSEATTPPPTQAGPEESERVRTSATVAPQLAEHAAEPLDTEMPASEGPPPGLPHVEEGVRLEEIYQEKVRMEVAGEAPKPPIDPPTSEQRIDEIWASYEGKRDAARLRSREAGQEDGRVDEARETGDLGFSATRMAIERADRRIREVAVTSFQRYSMLSDELAASRLEVAQLSTQLAEERAENQAWRARMEAKEAEWEKRFQDMAAMVERLSATKVVDWTEQSRYGIQGKEVQGLFGQEGTTEPPQQGGMGKVFLDPTEVAARREAEEGRFNFRTPTELASQQATPMTIEISEGEPAQIPRPPVAEGGPTEKSPTILLEVQGGTLTGAAVSAEPEVREGEASCLDELVAAMELEMPSGEPQRQETPERVPEMGELRTQLGSWATGADSGEHISEQHQEVMSESATVVIPQPYDLHRDEGATVMGGVGEGRPQRLDTPAYQPEGGETRAGPNTPMLKVRPAESWSMPQIHEMSREASETPSLSKSQKKKGRRQRRSDEQCFFCKHGVHRALECSKFLKDKAVGKVTEGGGRMYDRQGRVVERAPDGGRAQLYRQNQEVMSE
ncbi:hypothetical protein CBR_g36579 [Chara braunii]|uniref:Integrase catalytic domain-containing protein n=1 Tax=Chara braunii TaxID=69332 RepID=A0A388JZ77_CHABU|nr:hypothetical protein CBR_g36579 [Chara braunii]|eukprot:GBG63092.1 hypothetical protein CBR_g36579 [Chara braunii]